MHEIAPGLWRWTAPHPDWVPTEDWDRDVGCVLYERADVAVFIDPLIPEDSRSFWSWADTRARGRPVHVLTTIHWHRRSRDELAERYDASVSRAKANLPPYVEPIMLRGARETVFWLPEQRTLIPGDRILGAAGGGLRLCPESWLRRLPVDLAGLRALLLPLLELPVQRVLVSHGDPVLHDGALALARCLSA